MRYSVSTSRNSRADSRPVSGYSPGMTKQTVKDLIQRRHEISADIEAAHEAIKNLAFDLQSIDATILLFDKAYRADAIQPRAFRPPTDWAQRGELTKSIYDILRLASTPLSTKDIAMELMITKGMNLSDIPLLKLMSKRIGFALGVQRDKGLVKSMRGEGAMFLWEVVR